MVILGALVQRSGVITVASLKRALRPALDLRYHRMIAQNVKALERGAKFVREG